MPTGNVTFKDGGTAICSSVALSSGQATCATSALSAGTLSITAEYSGDGNFNASTCTLSPNQTVNKANTTTTVTSSANPAVLGQSVTFTANVVVVAPGAGTPTGTVQFKVDGANLETPVTLSGGSASVSTAALTVGTRIVTADYGGDGNFNASTGTLSGGQVVGNASLYLPLILR